MAIEGFRWGCRRGRRRWDCDRTSEYAATRSYSGLPALRLCRSQGQRPARRANRGGGGDEVLSSALWRSRPDVDTRPLPVARRARAVHSHARVV